jgi:hypothetical protein
VQLPLGPKVRSVVDVVQVGDGGVAQLMGVPAHTPLLHESFMVQALPSSQAAPSA